MKLLLDRGADIDAGSTDGPFRRGRTAVHDATSKGLVEPLEFLISRGANVNAVDANGSSPLFVACASSESRGKRVAVTRTLLDAGADATYVCSKPTGSLGGTALLMSTFRNDLDMIDLLVTRAPAALDLCYVDGLGPLALAAREGHEGAVMRLLKAGVRYKPGSGKGYVPVEAAFSQGGEGWSRCPLEAAVGQGHTGVARILLTQDFEVLGGTNVVASSLRVAVDQGHAKIVRMLLDVQGESQREHWANFRFKGTPALTLASCYGSLATVNVLLAAGADETAVCDVGGAIASDIIGRMPPDSERPSKKKSAAIFRSLERGPAYRARSWTWVTIGEDKVTTGAAAAEPAAAAAAAAAATAAKCSSLRSWGTTVRIFRPTREQCLSKSIGRYVLKGQVGTIAKVLLGGDESGAARLHDGLKRGRVPIPGRTKVETCRHESDAHLPDSYRKLYYMRTEC